MRRANLGSVVSILFAAIVLSAGCALRSSPIPNAVSNDEYAIYAAWLKQHFKTRPERLLLATRTFSFNPMTPGTCNIRSLRQDVNVSLLEALQNLGEAPYSIDTQQFDSHEAKIPWTYEASEGLATNPPPPFQLISFSRVAFNWNRTRAFFAVDDACGGLCGDGSAVLASRTDGGWTFKRVLSCTWTA